MPPKVLVVGAGFVDPVVLLVFVLDDPKRPPPALLFPKKLI